MTAVLLGHFKHESPEWHAARAAGLGGSEIAAVLGLSPWESHFSLWYRKQGRLARPVENQAMNWGKRLESAVLQAFRDQHPELVVTDKCGTWAHASRRWQVANPDGLAHPRGHRRAGHTAVVEVKTAAQSQEFQWGEPGTDQIPPYYLTQTRWYLDVLGLDTCHVAVLIGGRDYREYVVHPDEADTQLMRKAGADFVASLAENRRPDIDAHGATYQAIKELPDGVIDGTVEVPADMAFEYAAAMEDAKEADARKRLMQSLMLDAIGDYRGASVDGRTVAMRAVTKDGRTYSLRPARTRTEGTAA